jgi:recombinational DNA repair protein (RecF pathway)
VVAALAFERKVLGMEGIENSDISNALTGEEDGSDRGRGLDFHVRLNQTEKERLIRHAADWSVRMGLSGDPQRLNLSKYARQTLLAPHVEDQSVTRAELIDFRDRATRLMGQIAKVGGNINQIAKVANTNGVILDQELSRTMARLMPLLDEADTMIRLMLERNL